MCAGEKLPKALRSVVFESPERDAPLNFNAVVLCITQDYWLEGLLFVGAFFFFNNVWK